MVEKVSERSELQKKEAGFPTPEDERLANLSIMVLKLKAQVQATREIQAQITSHLTMLESVLKQKQEEFDNLEGGQLLLKENSNDRSNC